MDWKSQTDEVVNTWASMQRQMWQGWLDAVQSFNGKANPDPQLWHAEYQKQIHAWESSVAQAIEKQNAWTEQWSKQLNSEKTPEVMHQWVEKVQSMMTGWTDAQTQLWNAWFESVRQMDPSQIAEHWEQEGQSVMEAWQEAAQRAQDVIEDWTKVATQLPKNETKK